MQGREKLGAYGAWAAVCFFWGTTYLAIRVGLETFPPTLFAGASAAGIATLGHPSRRVASALTTRSSAA